MTEPEVYLEQIAVDRMPGFPPTRAFKLDDFAPGINIIYGPNTSGKTTVAEAITLLLHGADTDNHRASLRGQVTASGDVYRVSFDVGRRSFQKNGTPDPGPSLPSGSADRYKIWLHELLAQSDPNKDFAKEVFKASAGGYDLRAAREDLGYREDPSTAGIKEAKAVSKAEKDLRNVRGATINPSEIEANLERLRNELASAQEKRATLGAIQQALEFQEHDKKLSTTVDQLAELPDALEEMTGKEPSKVEQLRLEITDAEGDLRDAETSIQDANGDLDDADIPEDDPPSDLVPTLRGRVQNLQQAEVSLTSAKQDLKEARGEEEELRKALGEVTDLDVLAEIDTGHVQDAEEVAEEAERLQARQETLNAVDAWLDSEDEARDTQALEDGVRALRRWLVERSGPAAIDAPGDLKRLAQAGSVLAILAGAAGGVLGVLGGPGGLLTSVAGGLVAVLGVIVFVLAMRTDQEPSSGAQDSYEREFARTDLDPPERWDRETVEQRLAELEEQLDRARLHQEKQRERERLAPDRGKLKKAKSDLEDEARKLSEEIGVALELEERTFLWFVRNLSKWQEARSKAAGVQEKLAETKGDRKARVDDIEEALEPYGYGRPKDAKQALAWVEDLDKRFQKVRQANKDLQQAKQDKKDAKTELHGTARELRSLFTNLDLKQGDDAGLQRLVEQRETYGSAIETRNKVRPLRNNALEALQKHPGYEEGMENLPTPKLQDLEDELEAGLEPQREDPEPDTDRVDELNTEIGRLEERIEAAKQAHAVEDALQELDDAVTILGDKMEEETSQVVGWLVAEHVHQQTRHEDRPPVFHRAGELLQRITLGRYKLDFDDGDPPAFYAIDTRYDEVKTLDELSSGTRIQLLLAIRLGFVEQQEDGAKLPLVLDETLATTDDIRAPAIIRAVLQIAREGRQVFYLTAQQDEVGKWSAALENGDEPLPTNRIINLAEQRTLEKELEAPKVEVEPQSVRDVPPPQDKDHEAYGGVLDVPPFNPDVDVGAAHLWYLVDDPHLLHSLLELGIERWGELASLREGTSELDTVIDAQDWSMLQAKAKALRTLQKGWAVGRGKPVDRAVLEEAPGVTDTKIDEVAELAEKVDGDPSRLLAALDRGDVPRFYDTQYDKLEEFLQREGYADERDELSPEAIQQRVLTSVSSEIDEGILDREEVLELLRLVTDPPANLSKDV